LLQIPFSQSKKIKKKAIENDLVRVFLIQSFAQGTFAQIETRRNEEETSVRKSPIVEFRSQLQYMHCKKV